MTTLDALWDEFLDRFERIPVWLPGTPMSLGDVGLVGKRGFIRIANLSDFGIEYENEATRARPSYYVASDKASTHDYEISGETTGPVSAVAEARAGMQVKFEARGAFVVRAENVGGSRIPDVLSVENGIAAKDGEQPFWRRHWIYVSEVVTAEPCIVLISGSDSAEATVVGRAALKPAALATLGHASADLRLAKQSGIEQYVVSERRTPFMWRGRCRRGWLRKGFVDRGQLSTSDEGFEDFDAVDAFDHDIDVDES